MSAFSSHDRLDFYFPLKPFETLGDFNIESSYLAFDCRCGVMAGHSSADYKALFLQEAALRSQAENSLRPTMFEEYIRACHNLLSRSVAAQDRSCSAKGSIKMPTGKYRPMYLRLWKDCSTRKQEIYTSICNYLGSPDDAAPRLILTHFCAGGPWLKGLSPR